MSNIANGAPPNTNPNAKSRTSLFGRWTGGQTLTVPVHSAGHAGVDAVNGELAEESPVDQLIVAGTAFGTSNSLFVRLLLISTWGVGYGLFNLVFSLLPQKIQYVILIHQP
jgi:hypothetical protein